MNDFNFFSSFEKTKLELKMKSRRSRGILIGVIGLVVLFYGFLGGKMIYYNISITNGEKFLNSPENSPKITELREKREATLDLKKYSTEIDKAAGKIEATDRVSSEFLDTIQKAFPGSVSLKYMSIQDNQLLLLGNTSLWTPSAELTHNLEATGLFSRVHVESISKEKDAETYSFSIVCDMKEVAVK